MCTCVICLTCLPIAGISEASLGGRFAIQLSACMCAHPLVLPWQPARWESSIQKAPVHMRIKPGCWCYARPIIAAPFGEFLGRSPQPYSLHQICLLHSFAITQASWVNRLPSNVIGFLPYVPPEEAEANKWREQDPESVPGSVLLHLMAGLFTSLSLSSLTSKMSLIQP